MGELVAIIFGINEVSSVIINGGYDVELVRICSDCIPALDLALGESRSDSEGIGELLEILEGATEEIPCEVEFQWVRGHSNHKMNDLADHLAYHHAKG